MKLNRRRVALAVVALLGLLAGACSGDDSGGVSGDDATATSDDRTQVVPTIGGAGSEAATDTTSLADRGPEPSGTAVYAWHTAFSPVWLDPAENGAVITPYVFQYMIHDAMLRHEANKPSQLHLAESYEIADDFTSATFTLREGLTFHNGEALTTDDVAFSYENYKGNNAQVFKDKTERVEIVDDLTITFHFKEPFLDFLLLYGGTASGAGWILPKDYYTEVGPDAFKQAPIGVGPFKFIENKDNTELVLEANRDYWLKNPGVENLIVRFITDNATRFAALQAGEVDFANVFPIDLANAIDAAPDLTLVPTTAVPFWLEFPGWEDDPTNPFNDVRVREAVELALDRKALSDAETGGRAPITGQWIPSDFPGVLKVEDGPTYDLERAKALMAEAGYADGFDVSQLTPLPPYFSLGERVITQLAEIGIRTKLNQMERAAFIEAMSGGKDALPGIIMNISGAGGDAAVRIRSFALCDGPSSRTCLPEIDARFADYEASTDPDERQEILDEVQQSLIDQHVFPFVYDLALLMAQGPKVANDAKDIWAVLPQYVYPGPWEDVRVKS